MSSTQRVSGNEMREPVGKKTNYLSKLVDKKKNKSEIPTDNPVTAATNKDIVNNEGEILSGSQSMVDPKHQTKNDTTKMSKTSYHRPRKQDSRASVAIHGPPPEKEPDHTGSGSQSMVDPKHQTKTDTTKMSKTSYHRPRKQDSRASVAIHWPSPEKEPDHTEKSNEEVSFATTTSSSSRDDMNRYSAVASSKMKDSMTDSKMHGSAKGMRVSVQEHDPIKKESKPNMIKTGKVSGDNGIDTKTDLLNTTVKTEKEKRKERSPTSKSVDIKSEVRAEVDSRLENSENSASCSDGSASSDTTSPVQPKHPTKDSIRGGIKQTDDPGITPDKLSPNSKTPVGAKAKSAMHESKQQTTDSKSSKTKLREKLTNFTLRDRNSPSCSPSQSLSENDLAKPAKTEDPSGDQNSKNPQWRIFVNPTKGEITDLEVDIVVSSEDSTLQGFGMVAKQLQMKGGEKFILQKDLALGAIGLLGEWRFIFSPGAGRLKCQNVVHVNIPRIQEVDQGLWVKRFTKLLDRLMKRVDCLGFRSLAIPLLGTGRNGAPTGFVIDLICSQIREFSQRSADRVMLQTIYIVHPDNSTVKTIETTVKREGLFRAPRVTKTPDVARSKSKTGEDHFTNDALSFIKRYSVKPETEESVPHEEQCPICLEKIESEERVELNKCHHVFCVTCFKNTFAIKPACPICNTVYDIIRGIQPEGNMVEVFRKESLPGYDGCGIIHIYYTFPNGIQDETHPHPGKFYKGTRREAFLPDNKEGQRVHRLLRKCFEQKLTFTIGNSRTTGREDVVTWNDVHHKTKIHGGPDRFGYPDPSYLKRVEEELAAKGITEATEPEE